MAPNRAEPCDTWSVGPLSRACAQVVERDAHDERAAGHVGAEVMTCGKVTSWTLLVSTARKSVISARLVVGLNV
jgi:hypothetical protein